MGKIEVEGFCVHLLQDVIIDYSDIGADRRGGGTRKEVQTISHGEAIHAVQNSLLGGWEGQWEGLVEEVCVNCKEYRGVMDDAWYSIGKWCLYIPLAVSCDVESVTVSGTVLYPVSCTHTVACPSPSVTLYDDSMKFTDTSAREGACLHHS